MFYLTGGNEPERIVGSYVSGNLFSLLGINVSVGRGFTIEDEQPGRERVIILSDALWRRRFGGSKDVIGRTVQLNDSAFTIIGVAPPEFKFTYPQATELWTPLTFGPQETATWGGADCKVVARLKPGVTLGHAREVMAKLTRELEQPHHRSYQDLYVQIDPLHEYHFGDMQNPLRMLLGAVVAVLLIACVNVANLSLARSMVRSREMAVRAAMGASRWRLIRQMLTESAMIAMLGGMAGVGLGVWGHSLLLGLMPSTIPRSGDVKINATVFGLTALVTMSAGIIAGVVPALQASKPDMNNALKVGARGVTAHTHTGRWRDYLVVIEMGLSFAL
ncbi:MAG: ABC transporter permease, partial [Acidobacteriota bacterium]